MKITFFSNFLNHHQTPFCEEMYKLLKDNFTFVSTMETPKWLLNGGYSDCSNAVYNLNAFTDENNFNQAFKLSLDSDIVLHGSAPEIYVKERILQNKHTFRYSERIFKKGIWQLFDPRIQLSLMRNYTRYRNKNLYVLCAGAYTAPDLKCVFAYPEKIFKWGYFTEVKKIDIDKIIAQKSKKKLNILWTARFLKWKHPELAIKLAYELKKKGYDFQLNIIGYGEMGDVIKSLIKKLKILDCVSIIGNMPNSEVLHFMIEANIFIFTSDRNEGWGAVLNEAMSNGCAVVASHEIGSVPFLIKHQQNGLIFHSGSLSSLTNNVELLIRDRNKREMMSKRAYETMDNEWNPKQAATNFIKLSNSLLSNEKCIIKKGPCSPA
jgi:glycosyltransferase involved in cell wall biosynthesis